MTETLTMLNSIANKPVTDANFENFEGVNPMPRTKKTDTQNPNNLESEIATAIAARYFGAIEEIAPQIAGEFWQRLDAAVATEIVKQRPGFLSGVGDRLAQLAPATTEDIIAIAPR